MGMPGLEGRGGKGSNMVTPVERPVGGKKSSGMKMMKARKMKKPRTLRSGR